MKKLFFSVAILILLPSRVLADLDNLMWAVFPTEKYEYMADDKNKKYVTDGQLKAVGKFYISLENKKIIFNGLRVKEALDSLSAEKDAEYVFTYEEFTLKKVIKLDNESYAFEGVRNGYFKRLVSGKLQLKKQPNTGQIVYFEMNEKGDVFEGIMNKYVILSSEKGKSLKNKFKFIDFGNYYGAMGSADLIKY
jgi:hypothetical protein